MFPDRLLTAIARLKSAVVVGLDPYLDYLPPQFQEGFVEQSGVEALKVAAAAVREFDRRIIDAISDVVPAVKPQAAFYERLGVPGISTLLDTIQYARSKGLLVILDAKRNDIAHTAEAYADAYLRGTTMPGKPRQVPTFIVDALTVTPYLGSDGVLPFVNAGASCGQGIFVLVKTSNPSSVEVQDLVVCKPGGSDKPLSHVIGDKVSEWGSTVIGTSGYSLVGAVVGATFPHEARALRRIMPRSIFLVPGVGAQGANLATLPEFFNDDGHGAIIAASRSLIYAYREAEWAGLPFDEATRRATMKLRDEVQAAREKAAKRPTAGP